MFTSIEEKRINQRTTILAQKAFSPETDLENSKKQPEYLVDVHDFADIAKLVDESNASKNLSKDLFIPCVNFRERFELDYSKYIYISIDEVGGYQQTFDRGI